MRRRTPRRRGHSLMLVAVFLLLMLALWSVAVRQLGTALRVRAGAFPRETRDTGSLVATARALALLQTGDPPTDPYVCATTAGGRSFTVTIAGEGSGLWSVNSAPTPDGESPDPMPDKFH